MSSDSTPRTAAGRPYITSEDMWDAWDESRPQDADGRHMIRLAEAVNRRIHTEAASPAASGDTPGLTRTFADAIRAGWHAPGRCPAASGDALREAWTLLNNAQVGPGNFPDWEQRRDRFLAASPAASGDALRDTIAHALADYEAEQGHRGGWKYADAADFILARLASREGA